MNLGLIPDFSSNEATQDTADMASFARSFKPPSYLSPRLRPGIGRTLSNSSDLSIASNNSGRSDDPLNDWVPSAPNTPGIPIPDDRPRLKDGEVSASSSLQSNSSRPIAIELPNVKKIKSAPVYTPPEPLSARGDLPGGYFPMHEDPNARVHHPHPFHKDSKLARHKSITLAAESHPRDGRKPAPVPATTSAAVPTTRTGPPASANMPVASYLAPGFHDTPLPMGKYYPSNYEQRSKSPRSPRPAFSETFPSSRASPQPSQHSLSPAAQESPSEDEVRRRMMQYQRDMVAQARLALNSSTRGKGGKPSISLKGLPVKELRYLNSSPHKPISPKLVPLGSPGPVTPMELESGGGYLDKGHRPEIRFGDTLAPPSMG